MVAALCKEIELRGMGNPREENFSMFENNSIATIYFGGGTPSILSVDDLQSILLQIRKYFTLSNDAEITLEANPDDISMEKLMAWKGMGINRLSIGIQSFIEHDLKWMNRVHDATQAIRSVQMAKEAGFKNYSIDLIFGVPGLSDEQWKENMHTALKLEVPHIAAYALTVEPKTALHQMIQLKKKENTNQEVQAAQYLQLMETLSASGYEHYEISNFALPGYRSRHNSSYWQGIPYIGIGPSAHSYNSTERFWNVANNPMYIKSLNESQIPFEKEVLSKKQRLEEYIMTSIRTIEGLDLNHVSTHFSPKDALRIEQECKGEIVQGKMLKVNNSLILTNEGKLLADAISVKLFE